MVNETSDRPRLTPKGARTRARIVEEAAALIHERGVAGTTLDDVKVAAEVSGSQMYHYFPDKNDLVQAVIDYQADTIVNHQRHALGSANGVEAWRNMVITAAKRTEAKGGCPLGSLGGQLAESDPEARALIAAGFDQWAAAIGDALDPFMPTGSSRPASTRTTSPLLCSPRSKEGFYSPRCNGVPARSKLRSIPSSPLPSADEPKPDSFTATAEVGSRLLDNSTLHEHDALLDPLPLTVPDTWLRPVGCSGLAFCELISPTLTACASWTWPGLVKADEIS